MEQIENESDTFDIGGEMTVHRLGFGAMRLTGADIIGQPPDEDEARTVLKRARELGVDFIDTADSYGPGVSERLIGEALAHDSEAVVIATKGGLLRHVEGEWRNHADPEYLHNAALCSLDRLRTDTIDLYQLHSPDPEVPFVESVQALADLKDRGLVEHVGLSNVSVEQLETAREIVDIATVQNEYNVVNRDAEDVLQACESADIGFIPWFPLGGGDLEQKGGVLDDIAAAHQASREQIALAWLLEHSPVALPIPGTSSVGHLEENVTASAIELTDAEMQRLS